MRTANSPGKPHLRNPMFRCMIQGSKKHDLLTRKTSKNSSSHFSKKRGYIMAKNKEPKTNAMRILDRMKISYKTFTYECDEFTDAQHTADLIGAAHETMFKTLVTVSPEPAYYVFVIPIDSELDLKKCAHQAGVKSLAMIHVKDILKITGYVRGGCSPIGMKKQFKTVIDISAEKLETFFISGGRIGTSIEVSPTELADAIRASFAEITA